MQKYEVTDNILDPTYFAMLRDRVMDENSFPWYFNSVQVTSTSVDTFMFKHVLYHHNKPNSPFFELFEPMLDALGVQSLIHLKLNLVTNTNGVGWMDKHRDKYTQDLSHNTAILYLNTTNGKTHIFPNGEEVIVDNIENRFLRFDAGCEHFATHQTDTDRRVLINMNYF